METKVVEWYCLRFANYCYEYEILEPVHIDFIHFLDQGPEYYNEHVKQSQERYDAEIQRKRDEQCESGPAIS